MHVKICFLLIRRKSVLHVQFVFLLIGSSSLEVTDFHCRPRLALHDLIFSYLHVLLTRASLLALAKSTYYIYCNVLYPHSTLNNSNNVLSTYLNFKSRQLNFLTFFYINVT